MKKYLQFLLLIIIIVPSVTFASWYNPFTWSIFHSKKKVIPTVQQVPVATTTESVQKDNTENEISSLKKEIEELKAKDSQPKPTTPVTKTVVKSTPTPPPKVAETPKITTVPVIVSSAPINPASQCLPTKKGWDAFAKALNDLNVVSVFTSYNDNAFGTDNRPSAGNARFAYDYTLLIQGKTKFYAQTSKVRDLVNSLPTPPYGTDSDLQAIKKEYLDALTHLENSYDLSLQAFKTFGDNPDNYISKTDIDASYALYKDSSDEYDTAYTSLKNAFSKISLLQTDMQNGKVSNCNFTFYTDRTIQTTISDEQLFLQQLPKSNATSDGNAVVSITTNLPISVSDNGSIKAVMRLTCNTPVGTGWGVDSGTFLLSHLDPTTVGVTIPRSGNRHQCTFVYSGNGNDLKTRALDFNF